MKSVAIKRATLESCVVNAQFEQVVVTRNGRAVALMVSLEHLDEEARGLPESHKRWSLFTERRSQPTINRAGLD